MPDILIRRMEMPGYCFNCSTKIDPDNRRCNIDGHIFEETLSKLTCRRDDDCPLHELPAHGDLIDRDEVVNLIDYYEAHFANFYSPKTFVFMQDQAFDVMRWIIKKAVTIVPAKEETKNAN